MSYSKKLIFSTKYFLVNDTEKSASYTVTQKDGNQSSFDLGPGQYIQFALDRGMKILCDKAITVYEFPFDVLAHGQMRSSNASKHDEFIVILHKYTLQGDGASNIVYAEVEEEIVFDGGLDIASVLPYIKKYNTDFNNKLITYGEQYDVGDTCNNMFEFKILSSLTDTGDYTRVVTNDFEASSGSKYCKVAHTRVSADLLGIENIILIKKRVS